MGKRSRRARDASPAAIDGRATAARRRRTRNVLAGGVVAVSALVLILIGRSSSRFSATPAASNQRAAFTRVGQNGVVFTISVPRSKTQDDENMMRAAEQLSAEEIAAGGSGQISVMVWPDDVPVPKEPPTTEFDGSMKTQVAGIFINPKLNIKHVIRFRDGATVAERDFGKTTR